jgi:excinuclease ABC subunit C
MLGFDNKVIYIGKAKNLKKRISSYFNKGSSKDLKTKLLISRIYDIEYIITQSEAEAFILENQLIKAFLPKYNISLKDDKNYPYIKITTQEPFPRILIVRNKINDNAVYFGPYPSLGSIRNIQRMLNKLFLLRNCKKNIDPIHMQRKCMQLDLGYCLGPCVNKAIKNKYDETVNNLRLFLSGKNKELLKIMTKEMNHYSQILKFEKAAILRDKLEKLQKLSERQFVCFDDQKNIQVWTISKNASYYYLLVQIFSSGKLLLQSGYYNELMSNLDIDTFLQRSILEFMENNSHITAKEIICDELLFKTFNVLKDSNLLNKQFKCLVPKRGDKIILLNSALKNAQLSLKRITKEYLSNKYISTNELLLLAKKTFQLSYIPNYIVAFDISHLQATYIVGASISYKKGVPYKKGYKHYLINNQLGNNDPACIFEIVYRCLKQIISNNSLLPDLLLIDGGKAQLESANKALHELSLQNKIAVFALAKQEEEFYSLNEKYPIKLLAQDPVLNLFQRIRDEVHRFAISYHRHKRKDSLKSVLSNILGLGEKRINSIYKHFGSIMKISSKDVDKLAKIDRIGKKIALEIVKTISNYNK